MRPFLLIVGLLAVATLVGAVVFDRKAPESEPPMLIFAAASLAEALQEVDAGRVGSGGEPWAFNFAGSNVLARQIEAGAPADLFVSANLAQVEALEARGRSVRASRFPLLGNRLVVVASAGTGTPLDAATGLRRFDRLAVADPAAVPAGIYSQEWLQRVGLWAELEDRLVPTLDVRAALAAVSSGSLPAGIVYATDAAGEGGVEVIYRVADSEGPPIRYYATVIEGSREPRRGREALAYLRGATAGAVFRRHGFDFLPEAASAGARE